MTQTPTPRIFKIGASTIVEDPSTAHLSIEEVQQRLAKTYPEVEHATYRTREENGTLYCEFIARAGRKG